MTVRQALIIEDDVDNIAILVQLLSLENVSSTVVENPTAIRDVLQDARHFDVVFLDLEMPNLDGYKVFHILKSELGLSAPIVAYTVHTSESNSAYDFGFDGFLSKPLNVDRFPGQLKRILAGEQVWELR